MRRRLLAVACALLSTASGGVVFAAVNPYGVVTDATRSEYGLHEDLLDMARLGGLGYMRVDWDWRVCQPTAGAPFDFSKYDRLVAAAERCGVTISRKARTCGFTTCGASRRSSAAWTADGIRSWSARRRSTTSARGSLTDELSPRGF